MVINRYTPNRLRYICIAVLLLALAIYIGCHREQQYDTPTPSSINAVSVASTENKAENKAKTKAKVQKVPVFYQSSAEVAAANAYVTRFAKIAQTEQDKFGIPASITLAQGLIESAAGQSRLAKEANNHFGIKCFSHKCAKGHCINATDDTHKDFFVKYTTAWESYRAHSEFLTSKNYKSLHNSLSYREWAEGLSQKGYATEPNYARDLITIIHQLKLQQYDKH